MSIVREPANFQFACSQKVNFPMGGSPKQWHSFLIEMFDKGLAAGSSVLQFTQRDEYLLLLN